MLTVDVDNGRFDVAFGYGEPVSSYLSVCDASVMAAMTGVELIVAIKLYHDGAPTEDHPDLTDATANKEEIESFRVKYEIDA